MINAAEILLGFVNDIIHCWIYYNQDIFLQRGSSCIQRERLIDIKTYRYRV